MKENILRTNLIKIFFIISLFISGCTDMGMLSEDAEKAFNEASVSADSEKLTEAGISFASGDTASSVTSDFSLATSGDEGSTISWSSSNTDVITVNEDGSTTVNRPSGSNAVVIITATVSKGSVTSTKTFTVTVLAADVVYHTITFNSSGGDGGSMSSQTVAEGAAANLTANAFTRDGYNFIGWDEDSDGAADYADGASYTMGNSNVSLNAVWTAIPTHTISFNANSGSGSMSSQTVAEGAAANLTANAFTRDGYTFIGWDEDSDGAADYADGASYTMGNSNVSLNAVWTAIPTHTITFNANSGSGSMSDQTVAEGAAANLTANGFTRTGYTFAGWDEDSDGAADYADGASYTMGTSNVTLYAVWTAIPTHTISFNSNGGSGSMSSQTVAEGAAANLTANAFTRAGYTFAGWDEDSDGAADYADGASYTMGNSNVSLNAVWTAITHTITFNANGGSGSMSSQTVAEGAAANLTANAFTRAGYTFAGWATTALGSVSYADQAYYTMGTSNVTLYAVWAALPPASHAITFIANGGSGSMSNQTIEEGAAANLTANAFTKSGYVFAGWSTVSGGAMNYADEQEYTMGSSDVTLYAVWRASDDLIVKYTFDSQNCTDTSGKGNNGTPSNVTYTSDGNGGYAASFNGSSSYIQLPYDIIRSNTQFTAMMRFKAEDGQKGGLLGYQNTTVSTGNTPATTEFVPIIMVQSDGKLRAELWNSSGGLTVTSEDSVDDGNWHTVYFSGSDGSIALYLDGELLGEATGAVNSLSMYYNQIGTAYGSRRDPAYEGGLDFWYYFEGAIDNFYLYNTALHE